MVELKTIISANIPVSLAARLKNKTKGTRSRVMERALTAYLDEEVAYDLWEINIHELLNHLLARSEFSRTHQTLIHQIKLELKK
jgi:hypothetical protein